MKNEVIPSSIVCVCILQEWILRHTCGAPTHYKGAVNSTEPVQPEHSHQYQGNSTITTVDAGPVGCHTNHHVQQTLIARRLAHNRAAL